MLGRVNLCFKAGQEQARKDHQKGLRGDQQTAGYLVYHRQLTDQLNKILANGTHPLRPNLTLDLLTGVVG